MALEQNQIDLMAKINADPTYDDANHSVETRRIAMRLFRSGLVKGTPVEGSDTAVDHLFLTDIGQLALSWYGPTSDDEAVVDWYALRIKQKLAKRSTDPSKGVLNWRNPGNGPHKLFERFMMEVGELAEALFRGASMEEIIGECVDVGAVAMMIGDSAKIIDDAT